MQSFKVGKALLLWREYDAAVNLLMGGQTVQGDGNKEPEDVQVMCSVWKEMSGDAFVTWSSMPCGNILLRERLVLKGLKRYKGDSLSATMCLEQF